MMVSCRAWTTRRLRLVTIHYRFPKGIVAAIIVLAGVCWAPLVQAQLRNGRTVRNLNNEATGSTSKESVRSPIATVGATHAQATRRVAVASSSGVQSRQAAVTGASQVSVNRQPALLPDIGYETESVLSPDDASDEYGEIYSGDGHPSSGYDSWAQDHGSSMGCDSMGCDVAGCGACGDFSDLAPTCTSMVCSPGCGPLMSLWCRMSVRAEVPLYWRRAMQPPALVTTSPEGTDADLAGELGRNTTQTLLGNSILDDQATAGVRLTFSTWLGSEQRYALMFRYWNAGTQDNTYSFSSDQFPILARPFLDTSAAAATQNTQLVSFPDDTTGSISVDTHSKLDGLELTLKRLIYQDRFTRVDWLYGYQHVSIDERLSIASNTTVTGNLPGLQGNTIAVRDTFQTSNDFNGVAYGLMGSRQIACWKMETLFRLGLGNLRRKVNIDGTTTTTSAGNTLISDQGLLARNTNRQALVDDTFVVVPEVGINFAGQIRPGLDFTVGYNYMLVPKVAQASQQIDSDLAVNLTDPLVGSLDPSLVLSERKYWINSLGLGLQLRY
jgi:hypothetical protein